MCEDFKIGLYLSVNACDVWISKDLSREPLLGKDSTRWLPSRQKKGGRLKAKLYISMHF